MLRWRLPRQYPSSSRRSICSKSPDLKQWCTKVRRHGNNLVPASSSATDFYEIFVSLIQQVVTPDASDGKTLTTAILLEAFQDPQGRFTVQLAVSHP